MVEQFNIRVYGLMMNDQNEILLVRERIADLEFTKLPGGGLELGEGTRDCLTREFKEETNLDVEIKEHFYTTDFFQISMFRNHEQIISIYYLVDPTAFPVEVNLENQEINIDGRIEYLRFFWVNIKDLNVDMFTSPIDKKVCSLFLKK